MKLVVDATKNEMTNILKSEGEVNIRNIKKLVKVLEIVSNNPAMGPDDIKNRDEHGFDDEDDRFHQVGYARPVGVQVGHLMGMGGNNIQTDMFSEVMSLAHLAASTLSEQQKARNIESRCQVIKTMLDSRDLDTQKRKELMDELDEMRKTVGFSPIALRQMTPEEYEALKPPKVVDFVNCPSVDELVESLKKEGTVEEFPKDSDRPNTIDGVFDPRRLDE